MLNNPMSLESRSYNAPTDDTNLESVPLNTAEMAINNRTGVTSGGAKEETSSGTKEETNSGTQGGTKEENQGGTQGRTKDKTNSGVMGWLRTEPNSK
ncbi:hypothetical protein BASA61_006893 [Batrachochytrium salamandrivorans]|nr:hypothetical protein BASA61_006893 [Batrachochytrium salamandrivorans]